VNGYHPGRADVLRLGRLPGCDSIHTRAAGQWPSQPALTLVNVLRNC
jgi:hypothetical protein